MKTNSSNRIPFGCYALTHLLFFVFLHSLLMRLRLPFTRRLITKKRDLVPVVVSMADVFIKTIFLFVRDEGTVVPKHL